ncbi:hypothetical protein D3C85_1322350 [compost metagenome]
MLRFLYLMAFFEGTSSVKASDDGYNVHGKPVTRLRISTKSCMPRYWLSLPHIFASSETMSIGQGMAHQAPGCGGPSMDGTTLIGCVTVLEQQLL